MNVTNTILTQHLTDLHSDLRMIAEAFVAWYTAFWALNAVALAWIFGKTKPSAEEHDSRVQTIIGVFFGVMNLCGTGTSVTMWMGVRKISTEIVILNRALLTSLLPTTLPGDVASVLADRPLPAAFVNWSLWTCAGTLLVMALVWFKLSWQRHSQSSKANGAGSLRQPISSVSPIVPEASAS